MDNNINENQQPMYETVEQTVPAEENAAVQQPVYQPVQQNNPFIDNGTAYQQPVNYAPVQAIKPRNNRVPLIIILCVIAVAIIVGVFFLVQLLNKTTYEKAERAYFEKKAAAVEEMADAADQNKKVEIVVSYGEAFGELVESEMDFGMLEDYIYSFETAYQDGVAYGVYDIGYGDVDVLTGEIWADVQNNVFVMAFPEIIDKYLVGSAYASVNSSEVSDEEVQKFTDAMTKWFEKTTDKYFELFGSAEISDKGSKTVNGVTYNYDVMTVEFTTEKLIALLREALVVLRDDEEVFAAFGELTDEFNPDKFVNSIDEIIASLDEAVADEKYKEEKDRVLFTMDVYLSAGEIVGRKISISALVTVEILELEQDGSYANVFETAVPLASTYIKYTDAGTVNSGKKSGEVNVTYTGGSDTMDKFTLTAVYNDIAEDGTGTAVISIPSLNFEANYAVTADSIEMDACIGGKEIITVTGTISDSTLAFEEIPQLNDENSFNINAYNSDVDFEAAEEISKQFEEYFESLGISSPVFESETYSF